MQLHLSSFDYHLPDAAIAQSPAEPRDSSRLLVVDRLTGTLTDKRFFELAEMLTDSDVLVLNDTKVFPARLFVQRSSSPVETQHGASQRTKAIELLLEKEVELTADSITWECMTKPGLKLGDRVQIPNTHVEGICTQVHGYTRSIRFATSRENFMMLLEAWAKTPIPPYIRWEGKDEAALRQRYQTIYAKRQGAMAAPTAGLHFTKQMLDTLVAKGVQIEYVTLHVGLGTFLPVKDDNVTTHHMHKEWYELTQPVASRLNEAKASGKRIIAVGTTVVRVLETSAQSAQSPATLTPQVGETDIYIYPPYAFRFVDSLITNFHTPKSTLLMLVCAFVTKPNTKETFSTFAKSIMGRAYTHALANGYRFYSFGDSMWIR